MNSNNIWKQSFHLEPPQGFLNDPNGLCYFKNEYHIYFQYCKSDVNGNGIKSWGHYKTKDFINYSFLGEALLSDTEYDKDGAYSGSALVEKNNLDILHIYYTGNTRDRSKDGILEGRGANVLYVNSQDGHNMSLKQILLTNSDYPEYCSCHVRDPKVWKDEDNNFYMVLGARDVNSKGLVLIYKSNNYTDFKFLKHIKLDNFGYMWECPDYFSINNKNYLLVSPQGLEKYETKYQNVYQSGYITCNGSIKDDDLKLNDFFELDMGFDFYAPQTFLDKNNNRILIGWLGLPDIDYINKSVDFGVQHCLTIPRIITEKDNKLYQNPIKELENLRLNNTSIVNEKAHEVSTPFELNANASQDFELNFDNKLIIDYNKNNKLIQMKFLDDEYGGGRKTRKAILEKCVNIRMLVDNSSIEIFFNNGEVVMTTRFYPNNSTQKVNLTTKNIDGFIYKLDKFNINYINKERLGNHYE